MLSIHMGLSAITKIPELALDKQEAHMLAEATANVARHYDVGIDTKYVDWANLIGVAGMVYGSRMLAYRARMARVPKVPLRPVPDAPKAASAADNVTAITPELMAELNGLNRGH